MSQIPRSILVTGGAGFIGTHLVNALVSRYPGVKIHVVDNLSNSKMPDVRRSFFDRSGISFYQTSVQEFFSWNITERYDQIYHLASPVGPAGVLNYSGRMAQMIINDAIAVADLAIADNAKLLLISTSEIYGKHPEGNVPQKEDLPKIVPSDVTVRLEYGVAKLVMEVAIQNLAIANPSSLHVNFIRPFNIVGPAQNGEAGFVLPRFVESALAGTPLTVFGDGLQMRTFTHVADIVDALIGVMESPVENRIYNVGNPANLLTIEELAHMVVRISGTASSIAHVDPQGIYGHLYREAWNKIADVARIQTEIGWTPKWGLEEIVRNCLDFAQGKLNIYEPDR